MDKIWRMSDVSTKRLLEDGGLISMVPTSQDDSLNRDSPRLQNIRQEGILV